MSEVAVTEVSGSSKLDPTPLGVGVGVSLEGQGVSASWKFLA